MRIRKEYILIIVALLLLPASMPSYAVTGSWSSTLSSSPGQKQAPMPLPGVDALDEYHRQLLFASRNIEEGDYQSARANLVKAMEIRRDDPMLYEMMGIACDADRDSAEAFKNFMRAGEMYLKAGDTDRAWKILGWLRTFGSHAEDVRLFESRLRELKD